MSRIGRENGEGEKTRTGCCVEARERGGIAAGAPTLTPNSKSSAASAASDSKVSPSSSSPATRVIPSPGIFSSFSASTVDMSHHSTLRVTRMKGGERGSGAREAGG